MNLYIYANSKDFSNQQKQSLEAHFAKVTILETADFSSLFSDSEPKVIAINPDIIAWNLPNETIAKIPNLKVICLQTTGYEWVDKDFCAKYNITLTNVPHYATNSVAEKCIFMALALAKRYPLYLQVGKMNYDLIGEDMYDKPTDIIGFGDIGQALAKKLDGIIGHKEICYYQRHKIESDYHYCKFPDMLAKSEFMFITCAKNPESIALFDDLSKFNPHTKVIIIANGFEDIAKRMVKMVEAGKLGGVAFESDDPEILNHKYRDNIFVTPQNAYCTKESLAKLSEIWTDTIISTTDKIINQVN